MTVSSAPQQTPRNAASSGSAANQPTVKDTKVHIPAFMPFFWLGLAAIAGSLLSDWSDFGWSIWLAGGVVCLVLLLILPRQKPLRKVPATMLLLVCSLTGMLYQFTLPGNTDSDISSYIGEGIVSFSGTITEPPEASGSSVRYVISAEKLEKEGAGIQKVRGKVLLSLPLGFDFKYGDRLEVISELIAPPAGSGGSWRDYLEHRGIHTYSQFGRVNLLESGGGNPLLRLLYGLRENGSRVIDTIFPAPENALLRGILLGDESQISSLAREAYSITGTSHIIAISGFNMAVLAGIVAHVFTRRLGAQKGSLLTIITLVLYTILVGAEASVLRAAFMGAFTVVASSIARRGNSLNNLGISVLLMMLINPHLPWDVGFQLSAMATLGLALLMSPLRARLTLWMNARFGEEFSARFSTWIGDFLLVTLVAQLSVLPLLLYHFRSFSWVFLIANPLILPVQPLVMILGLVAMTVGLASLPLGRVLAWIAWPFAAYTNRMVFWLASNFPHRLQVPRLEFTWVLLAYLVLAILVLGLPWRKWLRFLTKPAFVLVALGSLSLALWASVAALPDGRLAITIFGESDTPMLLVRNPAGQYILVNGESEPAILSEQIESLLPPFERKLEVVIIPDCRQDQVSGLFGLTRQVKVGQVLWGCEPDDRQISKRLWSSFAAEGISQTRLTGGELLDFRPGSLSFTMADENLQALVLKQAGFTSWVIFEYSGEPVPPTSLLVQHWQEGLGEAKAQVWVLTGDGEREKAGNALWAADYHWLRVETNGLQQWLSGKIP
jgi:competence protein ComEC